MNVWQRATHEACVHIAAGEQCKDLVSEHHEAFVQRQEEVSSRVGKRPLFVTPNELCDVIVERFHLSDHGDLEPREWCDEHFAELVAHASRQHWQHLNPHEQSGV